MLKQHLPRRSLGVWLVSLLLLSLTLAACSGSTESVSEEPAAAAETEEATTPTETEEAASPAKEEEEEVAEAPEATATEAVAASEEAETAPQENLAPTATEVTCQSVDIPDNGLIAAVSDSDWVKGPANAPVTLIEYGDFQ